MHVDTSHLSEIEIIREIDFLESREAVGPTGYLRPLLKAC